jgi:hypothetical protein
MVVNGDFCGSFQLTVSFNKRWRIGYQYTVHHKNIYTVFRLFAGYKKVIFSPIGALFLPYATVLFFILLTNITSIKSKLV